MAIGTFTERLALLITADTANAVRELKKVGDAAERDLGKAERKIDKLSGNLTRGGAAAIGFAAVASAGLFQTGVAASNLEQAINATSSIFGENADVVQRWAKNNAAAFGISERLANQFGARVGAQLLSMGFSAEKAGEETIKLEKLAADLAATFGGPVDEAFTAVAALFRGERDPIEKFGVSLKQVDIDARIAALGLDTSTAATKKNAAAVASLELLYEQTAGAQGQFARESDTFAGQQRILTAEFENLKAEIGQGVLPVMQNLVGVGNDVLGFFNGLDEGTKKGIGTFATFATAAVGTAGALSLVAGQVIKMRSRFLQLDPVTGQATGGLNKFGKAAVGLSVVGATVGVVLGLKEALEGTKKSAEEVAAELSQLSTDELTASFRDIADASRTGIISIDGAALALDRFQSLAENNIGTAQRLRDALKAQGEDVSDLDAILREEAEAQKQATTDAENATTAIDRNAEAADVAAGAHQTYAEQIDIVNEAQQEAEERNKSYTDAIFGTRDAAREAIRSFQEFETRVDELAAAESEHGAQSPQYVEALFASQEAIDGVAQSALEAAEQQAKLQGKELDAATAAGTQRDALLGLRDTIQPGNPLRSYLDELIAQLDRAAQNRSGNLDLIINTISRGATSSAAFTGFGKRARGGPVSAGESYVVGEEGPEVLTVGQSGRITPNDKIGGNTFNFIGTNMSAADVFREARWAQITRGA